MFSISLRVTTTAIIDQYKEITGFFSADHYILLFFHSRPLFHRYKFITACRLSCHYVSPGHSYQRCIQNLTSTRKYPLKEENYKTNLPPAKVRIWVGLTQARGCITLVIGHSRACHQWWFRLANISFEFFDSVCGGCSIHWPQRMVEPAFGFGGSNRTCIWDLWLSFFFLSLLGFVFPCCFGMQVGGGGFLFHRKLTTSEERGIGFGHSLRGQRYEDFLTLSWHFDYHHEQEQHKKRQQGEWAGNLFRRYWRNKVRGFHYTWSITMITKNNNNKKSVRITWALFRMNKSEGKGTKISWPFINQHEHKQRPKQERWWLGHYLGGRISQDQGARIWLHYACITSTFTTATTTTNDYIQTAVHYRQWWEIGRISPMNKWSKGNRLRKHKGL